MRAERGVEEPTKLTAGYGALWASFGRCRLRVAGPHADVVDEARLFEEIDRWVAFERSAGPGIVLDRDLAVIEEWRARLPLAQAVWEEAAALVFHDVEATTSLRWTWRITVHDDEEAFPDLPEGVSGVFFAEVRPADWEPPRRKLALPELWLETDSFGIRLPEPDGSADAVAHVADRVQDEVMEEIVTTWPPCPGHQHPLAVGGDDTLALWVCPGEGALSVPIGSLRP
jgi:hypothetical protein